MISTDTRGKLHVLRHYCNPLCMNRAHICVFEQSNEVRLTSLLQRQNSWALEAESCFILLWNFTNQALKWKFTNEQIMRFLVLTNFSQCNRSRAESMRLLETAYDRRWLPSRLYCELLSRRFCAYGLSGSLFRASHFLAPRSKLRPFSDKECW